MLFNLSDAQVGAQGAEVREIQTLLTQRGYAPGPIDGIFGPQTKTAVMRFQSDRGFVIDGIVGPMTWAALHGTLPTTPAPSKIPAPALSQPSVMVAQEKPGLFSMFGTLSPPVMILGGIGILAFLTMATGKKR